MFRTLLLALAAMLALSPASPSLAAEQKTIDRLMENRACQDCDLSGADLRNVYLYKATLVGANLRGANLAGAILFRADLCRANLTDATWVDGRKCGPESIGVCK